MSVEQDREARGSATRSTGVPTSAQPDETPLGTSREQIAANFEKRRVNNLFMVCTCATPL